jgi:hypothetical protein
MTAAHHIPYDDPCVTPEQRKTAAREVGGRAGDLSYLLHEGQLEALECMGSSKRRRFLMNVGRRWGKSRLMCVIAVWVMLLRMLWRRGATREALCAVAPTWLVDAAMRTKRKARVLYAAPTGDMIAEFVAPHMELLIEHCPVDFGLKLFDGEYVMVDGDRIVMKGCEDKKKANRLRGSEADLAIVDEWGSIPILGYVVKSVIGFQLIETRGRMLMPSTPPEEADHPGIAFLEEAQAYGAYYHAETEDAPHITQEMIDEIIVECGGKDTVDYMREARAMIVRDPQLVVLPEFGEHLVGVTERPPYFLPCIIGDMGFTDWAVILFGYYHWVEARYVIEREVGGQRVSSDDLDEMLRATADELWPGMKIHRRRLDSTPRERDDLNNEKWQSEAAEDGADMHWGSVSRDGGNGKGRMRSLANHARIECKNERLLVHPSCKTAIAHMTHARWNTARDSFVRVHDENGEPIHHYDGCAAGLYFLRDCDATTNPWPRLGPGVTSDTHHVPPELLAEKKKIRQIFGRGTRR